MPMYELLTPLRRRGGEPVPAGTAVPLPWDDGEALVRLGAAVRVEVGEIAPGATDADRNTRRRGLLRELVAVSGVDAPSSAGAYLVTVDDAGVTDIQAYDPKADPLASGDPTVVRRHYLDALRVLDDLTYLGFDDAAAADLGGLVLLSMDAETGLVTAVTSRSAVPAGFDVAPSDPVAGMAASGDASAGTGAAAPLDGVAGNDGQTLPPVAVVPADDETLARMTKAQLLAEAARVHAPIGDGMTKAELVEAIVAKRL